VLAGIVHCLVMGGIVASRAAFRNEYVRSGRDVLHFMGVLWLYLPSSFAHQAVGDREGENL